jgi:hypothetical protein
MYAKFKISADLDLFREVEEEKEKYLGSSKEFYEKNKVEIRKGLENYLSPDGRMNMKELEEDWFPNIKADIFLSHSHQDEEKAKLLAFFLKEKFGLTTFIDSIVWKNVIDLLKKIDEKYNKIEGTSSYSYEKSIRAAANVHLTLMMALIKMIDKCECAIFMNTPNSLEISNSSKEEFTASPWIYSEIEVLNRIQQKKPTREKEIRMEDIFNESFNPRYNIQLKDFKEIDNEILSKWLSTSEKKISVLNPKKSLDILYRIMENKKLY